jgi:hypothetical protein
MYGPGQDCEEGFGWFVWLSGLITNLKKIQVFLSIVDNEHCAFLQTLLGFRLGSLPIRCLQVPLISTRLTHNDRMPLMDWILSMIKMWTSTSLTYAGCLQLIKFILFSMKVYWCSNFILGYFVIKRIESILATFLWKGCSLSYSGAKVAWALVCYRLKEGGLGIQRIKTQNKIVILKHV